MNTLLAVETNSDNHKQQAAQWAKYGIKTNRVDTMHKAISLLDSGEEFLLVTIREDTVPNFLTLLHVMRDITNAPILVNSSSYTVEKKIKALSLGADVYDPDCADARDSVLSALELLKVLARRASRPAKSPPILTGGDIILSQSCRQVFVKESELYLAKKEFDILQCLMSCNGHVVTHTDMLHEVWGPAYTEDDTGVLWRTINRLRNKLNSIPAGVDRIKIDRGVGYRFSPQPY